MRFSFSAPAMTFSNSEIARAKEFVKQGQLFCLILAFPCGPWSDRRAVGETGFPDLEARGESWAGIYNLNYAMSTAVTFCVLFQQCMQWRNTECELSFFISQQSAEYAAQQNAKCEACLEMLS